jgi:hypothetical protein
MINIIIKVNCRIFAKFGLGAKLTIVDKDDKDGAWWPLVCSVRVSLDETKCNINNHDEILKLCQVHYGPLGYDIQNIISIDQGNEVEPGEFEKLMKVLGRDKNGQHIK